jgi:hypothetical protein
MTILDEVSYCFIVIQMFYVLVWTGYIAYLFPYMHTGAALNNMHQPVILLLFSYFWFFSSFINLLLIFVLEVIFLVEISIFLCDI